MNQRFLILSDLPCIRIGCWMLILKKQADFGLRIIIFNFLCPAFEISTSILDLFP